MKGIVFTEFLDMVEARFTPEVADRMITAAAVPSDGAYTTVGTYDYRELIQLVAQLSTLTSIPSPTLVHTFGVHLFDRFVAAYPALFAGVTSAFSFLKGRLTMLYRSSRPFADLAEGLIAGCIAHFGEPIVMHRDNITHSHGTQVRFVLTKQDSPA